jgi:hypothetical protein
VVGFSIPVQKVQWYEHPGLVGAALVVGSVLALVPEKLDRLIALACVVVALGWPLITLEPWESRPSQTQRQIAALQSATGPRSGDAIADGSSMD